MLSHVHGSPPILTPYSQPLEGTNDNEGKRSKPTRCVECRKQTNQRRGPAHDGQGDKKSVLAPYEITDLAKKQSTEWPHNESYGKCGQIGDIGEGFISWRVELQREDCGQASEYVEIVPLDHCSSGRGRNHTPNSLRGTVL